MKGLLVKDFRLMITQKKFFIMMLLFSIFITFTMDDPSFIIGYITFLCTFFSISTISYDEFNNGYAFLFTLPINKKQYICSKYIFAIMTALLSWSLSMTILYMYKVVTHASSYPLNELISYFIIMLVALMLLSIMLPIKLKFGSEKGNIIQYLVFGIIFASGFLFTKIVDIHLIVTFLKQLNLLSITFIIFIFTLIILFVSYMISFQIMKKKEF